ncbi:MAG: 2,3-bisphosphoglycerate-independent phosphoglycerate mutase [Sediminibacterium sp.]|nr:2,3-bisphosphoglycerate-independent phosphoglycerate mutase [Sediminibacterium sp.]
MNINKGMLIIMDGWGIGRNDSSNAIYCAQTPFIDSLYQNYPHSTLITFGEDVGLPEGQMGNSEVGHLNLGAGRIVYQELQRINVAIRDKSFFQNPELLNALAIAKEKNATLHLLGLVSNGGVHSHINHVEAIVQLCYEKQISKVFIHAFTDGRDCDPKSGLDFIKQTQEFCSKTCGKIATISGRYYAMDRDNRWERIKLAYDALVHQQGNHSNDLIKSIEDSYQQGITDEFIKPIIAVDDAGIPLTKIADNDVVICFNFRTDRCREITTALTQKNFPDYQLQTLPLHYYTMTCYDEKFKDIQVLFENDNLDQTLGEIIAQQGLKQIRMAETEKYPHVTFFFSGGREQPFDGEERLLVPSPKVATYDLQPEMSANELTIKLLPKISQQAVDFICLNFANTDMVGHTGVFSAAIKAAETVNNCVEQIVKAALLNDYFIVLLADHGNSDYMVNDDGSPNTQHSMNLVPVFIISNQHKDIKIKSGKLGDIAPTILKLMGLPIPSKMTGNSLI